MKALEILELEILFKHMESVSKPIPKGKTPIFAIERDRWFEVLRAFRVMREIAIDQTKRPPLDGYADEFRASTIDGRLEEAMKKGEE